MAIAGLQNVSVLDSSFLCESRSQTSRRRGGEESRSTRPSPLLQMWREFEDEHVASHSHERVNERLPEEEVNGLTADLARTDMSESLGSEHGGGSEEASVSENEFVQWSPNRFGTQNGHGDPSNLNYDRSSRLGEVERERVRQIFREWMNTGARECPPNISRMNQTPRAEWLGETEQERVRIIRGWVQLNSQQRGACGDSREEQTTEMGGQIEQVLDGLVVNQSDQTEHVRSRRGIRRLCGRQALLDMIKNAESERKRELQGLLEHRAVSNFAYRNRIQSLLRGRFLRNDRVVEDERPRSTAARELGLLRQRHTVSGLREGFISRLSSSHSDTSSNADINGNRNEQFQTNNSQEVMDDFREPSELDNDENASHSSSDGRADIGVDIIENVNLQETTASVEEWQEQVSENEDREWERSANAEITERRYNAGRGLNEDWQGNTANELSQETLRNEHAVNPHLGETGEVSYELAQRSREESATHGSTHAADNLEGNLIEDVVGQESAAIVEDWQEQVFGNEEREIDWQGASLESNEWRDDDGEDVNENHQESAANQWTQDREHDHLQDGFQEAVRNWLEGPADTETYPVGRMDTFYLPDDDNVYNTELRELLSRRSVSNLLRSGFRESLDRLIQSYVERRSHAPIDWEIHATSTAAAAASAEQDLEQQNGDQTEGQRDAVESPPLGIPSPPVAPVQPLWVKDEGRASSEKTDRAKKKKAGHLPRKRDEKDLDIVEYSSTAQLGDVLVYPSLFMRSASLHLHLMASSSSSSSSITPKIEYEVFLSFHGVDTRQNITSHLYEAFCQKKIRTFIDDRLVRGEQISISLLKAIEHSKISVIIFSKGYASSRWCLRELEEIVKCKNTYDQIVIPVFYQVDPSDVRNQTGDFGKAFAKLEKRFMDDSEMLQRWRTALRDAANLSGYDSKNSRNEATLVKDIANDIWRKLDYNSSFILTQKLVGLESSIEEIENLLCLKGVCKLGIWGIGGIGKTTLASAIFEKISKQFEASYFILNIREDSEKSGGLNDLCQKLSSAILGDEHLNHGFTFRRKSLISRKKVLIVFDDVTKLEQIECLMRVFDDLDSNSRIIITTRDKHVLRNCEVDHIHEMKGLCSDNALQLFALYAFRGNTIMEDYVELSSSIVAYADGVPLALKVLGSFLLKRTKREWESALKNLRTSLHVDVHKVLKISYDGLNDKEKVVFLDIACFFKGYKRDLIEAILNTRDFDSHIYLNVLIERSLITTSSDAVTMHDLLEEMAREIVRQESNDDPGKRSRLWHPDEIFSVLKYNMGTRAIRSICLDMFEVEELHLNPKAFNNMRKLRFLKFHGFEHGKKVHGFEKLKSDFFELRYFNWHGYSAKSLPPNFNPKNLVALYLRYSEVKQLWTGNQKLVNLKHIDLSHSRHLCRIPDLSLMPNLESLRLEYCTNLLESFSSIHNLHKLVILELQGCKSFDNLPISSNCQSLREVNLSNCSNLKKVSYLPNTVEELYLDGTAIKEFPLIGHLFRLVKLSLRNCSRLERLPNSICELKSLKCLYLSGCSKLDRLLNDIGNLQTLEILELEEISFAEIPTFMTTLINLETLSLTRCKMQKRSGIPLVDLSVFQRMRELRLINCCMEVVPNSIGQLPSLVNLSLDRNNLETLPENIKDLSKLQCLYLRNCQRLKYLPELPRRLQTLVAENCISLESISSLPAIFLDKDSFIGRIKFFNCFKLKLDMIDAFLNMERNADGWYRRKICFAAIWFSWL